MSALARTLSFHLIILSLGALCGLLALVSPVLPLAALLAAVLAMLAVRYSTDVWKAEMIFLLIGSSYLPPPFGSLIGWAFLGLFLAAAWKDFFASGSSLEFGDMRIWWAIAGWMIWAVFSAYQAVDPAAGLKEIGRYAFTFSFFLTYLNWIRSRKQLKGMMRWWEILSVIVAGVCLLEAFFWIISHDPSYAMTEEPPTHIKGPNPPTFSEIGGMLAAMIPVSLSLLLSAKRLVKRRLAGILLMSFGLWVTMSRASVLAAFAGSLVVFCKLASPRIKRLIFAATVALGILMPAYFFFKYQNLETGVVHNLSGRNLLWGAALKAAGERPVLGIGPGCWHAWFEKNFSSVDFIMDDMKGNTFVLSPALLAGEAHSLFFTKAAEMGWPAIFLFLIFCASWVKGTLVALSRMRAPWFRALTTGSLGAMTGLFVRCFFENGPIIGRGRGYETVLVWFVAALPFVLRRFSEASASGRSRLSEEAFV